MTYCPELLSVEVLELFAEETRPRPRRRFGFELWNDKHDAPRTWLLCQECRTRYEVRIAYRRPSYRGCSARCRSALQWKAQVAAANASPLRRTG